MIAVMAVLLLRASMHVLPWRTFGTALVLLVLSGATSAETLILIQGLLGNTDRWRDSGVTLALEQAGWYDAGRLSIADGGVRANGSEGSSPKRFYTIDLPTFAPLLVQAETLDSYVSYLRRRYPHSGLVLAGHSAGGVLARLYMVQHHDEPFAALITIASPHLGSRSAELGAEIGERTLGWMADLFGRKTLEFHWGLVRDLRVERPYNLLGWLNHQPHPRALYVSIVRKSDAGKDPAGNLLVPAWSQDMNQVFALHGRVRTIAVDAGHGLRAADGRLLARILGWLRRA
jgi:pimeloyl-ACP methyl ester carboxylesterase